MKSVLILLVLLPIGLFAANDAKPTTAAQKPASIPSYVITDDDPPFKIGPVGSTFYPINSDGTLGSTTRVSLGGAGAGGGYFTASRVSVLQSNTQACAFASMGGAAEVAALDINALQDIGDFSAASTDLAVDNGMGLANNGTYLYASYSTSNTLATFAILPGCNLNFLGDVSPIGKHLGNIKGMAVRGNILVIAYGDGSIESFNVSSGIPVPNGDLQNATGYTHSVFPVGVDITQDGHFAIFGDQATYSTVEVSDISSGKLTKTALYTVGNAGNSTNIYLSPDQTLLYIGNTGNGKVTAGFFDSTTGKVTFGCTSPTLKGFDNKWIFLGSVVTALNTGTGSQVYLAEFGAFSGVAVVNVTSSGGTCTLTEAATSPFVDPNSTSLISIGVYPPRQF